MKKFIRNSLEIVLELSVIVIGKEIGMYFLMDNISRTQFSSIFVCGGLSAIAMMFLIDLFKNTNNIKNQE